MLESVNSRESGESTAVSTTIAQYVCVGQEVGRSHLKAATVSKSWGAALIGWERRGHRGSQGITSNSGASYVRKQGSLETKGA